MALQTVTLVLDETWRLISNSVGRFKVSTESNDGALFYLGDVAPAATYAGGQSDRRLDITSLETKVWAKAAAKRALITVTRVVDALNHQEIVLGDIGLSVSTFASSLAPGAEIGAVTGRIAGDGIRLLPKKGGLVELNSDRTKLVRGLGEAPSKMAAVDYEIEIEQFHPLAANSPKRTKIPLIVTLGAGGGATVRRAVSWGTHATNVKDGAGTTQSGFGGRDAIYLTKAVKAGEEIEFGYPLWTNERIGGICQEVMIEEANDFQFAMEYPFADSSTTSTDLSKRYEGKANGQKTYSYVPGQSEIIMVFKVTAPVDIPALTPIGVILYQDNVAGRTAAVTNKRIQRINGISTFMGRKGGNWTVNAQTGGGLAADPTMTKTTFLANSASQIGGLGNVMLPGAVRISVPSDTPCVYIDDNSIGQASNEGTPQSTIGGVNYGDVGGNAYGNSGYAMRTLEKLGIGGANGSRGSDSLSNHLQAGFSRRIAFAAWMNATGWIGMNMHNDSNVNSAAQGWVSGTAYALDDVVTSGGRGYVCLVAGSGTVAPAGTALSGIASGTAQWGYLDEIDITAGSVSLAAITYFGKLSKYVRAIKAAMPGVKVVMPTCPPDASSQFVASAYSYNATTGELRATFDPAVATLMEADDDVRIVLTNPANATVGTAGANLTKILRREGNDLIFQRATGLAAPTSTTVTLYVGAARPALQTPTGGYTPGNSIRSVIHRYLRRSPATAIPIDAVMDLAKSVEHNSPTTMAAETGVFKSYALSGGRPLGFAIVADVTHLTSFGNEYAANDLAADTALAALLRQAA